MSQILESTPPNLQLVAKSIKNGGLVVVPTDTIYVVVCDAFNNHALTKLRKIRKSPLDKPLTTVIQPSDVEKYAKLTKREQDIIDTLHPSSVSIYVQKKNTLLDLATTYSDFVCVFWQDNETKALYEYADTILAISSANEKGLAPASTLEQALGYFGEDIEFYIDGGNQIRGNQASVHIDIRKEPIELRRSGSHFPYQKIQNILAKNSLK